MQSMNVEQRLADWLGGALSVPVFWSVPESRPPSFVTVERTGGARDSQAIDRPTVAIQCWAGTRAEASCLAYEVDSLLPSFAREKGVCSVRRNSLVNWPDIDGTGSRPRYQIVVDLVTTH